jgi:hypothetical protein
VIIRRSAAELLHIGRPRRYDRASARAILERMSQSPARMEELRTSLSLGAAGNEMAALGDAEVLDELAKRVARGEMSLVWLRPPEANAPEIKAENEAPFVTEVIKEAPKEEKHWLEIELVSDVAPHEPVAYARYVVELPNGQIVEGFLDAKGKARLDGIPKGDCKVTFPEHSEPVPEGDVEIEEAPPPPEAETEECKIASVVVSCEHVATRKKKVALPAPKNAVKANELAVVGAHKGKGEKITAKVTMAEPRCATHKDTAIVVKTPHGDTITFGEDEATFEVYHGNAEPRLVDIWPWDERPVTYTVTPIGCSGGSKLVSKVHVYPGFEPSLSFTFSLDTEDRVKSGQAKARLKGRVEKRGRPPQTEWALKFEAKVKYGTRARTLGAEFEGKLRQMAKVNLAIKRILDDFSGILFKFIGIVLLPEFPNLSLAYEGKFKEIDGQARVGAEYSLMFKADPLFGVTLKIEILDVLIAALGKVPIPGMLVVSEFLAKVRKWAKENDQTIELYIAFSGLIGGEVGAEKKAAKDKADLKGKIEGKLKVAFSAKASFGSQGMVGFAFGAEVGGDTGVALRLALDEDDKGLFLKGSVVRLACTIKWSAWASGKFFWELKESYEDEHQFWDETNWWESDNAYIIGHA